MDYKKCKVEMRKIAKLVKKSPALYSFGVIALVVVAALPATFKTEKAAYQESSYTEVSMDGQSHYPSPEKYNTSPASMSTRRESMKANNGEYHHVEKSLSPKAKNAFKTLPKNDKDRIKDAHESGKSTHKELKKVLDEDHKDHSKKKAKSMRYGK